MIKTICTADSCQHLEMTAEEETILWADQEAMQAEQTQQQIKADAHAALKASDLVAVRCLKAGVSFPAEWQAYVVQLRAVAVGAAGPLPDQPAFPAGT
ncbi:MAG: hypothetical protein HY052_08025 [Proteobacteria bacterium]|nr:hypothetical protein [Pseudomonadota bacterium]